AAPFGTDAWFYRTRAGAEIDLLLHLPDRRLWAIEIKRSTAPRAARGFELAASDLRAAERFVVHPGREPFPLSETTTAIPLTHLMERLQELARTPCGGRISGAVPCSRGHHRHLGGLLRRHVLERCQAPPAKPLHGLLMNA
ncbi:MAG: hypothetical protein OXC11_02565, partial [Rhodospirillales bacterium]|nr:hypothetical protein [Rhodospirillales bacterium]